MRIAWQILIVALIAIGFGSDILTLTSLKDAGDFGVTAHVHDRGLVVDSVAPDSPAARVGIHAGDRLNSVRTFESEVIWSAARAGDTASTYVNGGKTPIQMTAVSAHVPVALLALSMTLNSSFLFMGALVAWRKSRDTSAQALALFLASFGCAMTLANPWVFPPLFLRFVAYTFSESLFCTGVAAALVFACRYPTAATKGYRATTLRLALPALIVGLAISISRFCLFFFGAWPDAMRVLITPYVVLYGALIFATIAAFIVSLREAEGAQRVQLRWIIWTFVAGFSGLLVAFALILLGVDPAVAQFPSVTIMLIPIGLGYLILRHRVLDITFVINRAVVYGTVSLIMITSFIIFEWIVGNVVQRGTGESLVFNVVGAIVLGFSVRYIHDRVDKRIDDIFFRERHLAEAAVRRFAHEAALITETNDLVQKTVEVAQRNVKLGGAAFYAYDDGMFAPRLSSLEQAPPVSENDYAVLEMRGYHKPVDLMNFETSVPGDYAFPMMVRGALSGFLACGPKLSHEALAPDEREALAVLARDCGIALDSLRVHHIERELADARATIAALVATPVPQLPKPQL